MINIEIKARYNDLDKARRILKTLPAKFHGKERQLDTYFVTVEGRLKMRQSTLSNDELIYYERADEIGPRQSNYLRFEIRDAEKLMGILAKAIGVHAVVDKIRETNWLDNIKIHFDDVEGLGTFIEFEATIDDEEEIPKNKQKIQELIKIFEIDDQYLIAGSYADLITLKKQSIPK